MWRKAWDWPGGSWRKPSSECHSTPGLLPVKVSHMADTRILLDELFTEWQLPDGPDYRREQLCQWVFPKRANSFEEMLNLPKNWREALRQNYELHPLEKVTIQGAKDATQKFLWKLRHGDYIESVLIPASPALYGEKSDRRTLCLSTQVGCAYGCKFCASGLEGFKRNLSPGEIVAQIIETERIAEARVNNLVFMGMGEPLANFPNLMKAIEIINAEWGLGIGARHITISTSGLAPQILELARQPRQLQLAISLHGASNEVRSQIMPVNKKYPIEELVGACETYVRMKQRTITLEYILIKDVNDGLDQAVLLAGHAKRIGAKINLIPYNTVEGLPWTRPSENVVDAFAREVESRWTNVTVRREKGHDIDAACGQLRLKKLHES